MSVQSQLSGSEAVQGGWCLSFRGFRGRRCDDFDVCLLGVGNDHGRPFSLALAVVITRPVSLESSLRLIKAHSPPPPPSGSKQGGSLLPLAYLGLLEWWRSLSPDYWRFGGSYRLSGRRAMEVVTASLYLFAIFVFALLHFIFYHR